MTTWADKGSLLEQPVRRPCPVPTESTPNTLTLALRDMRAVNGRNPVTGEGVGNESLVALTMAMIVLDTLAGPPTDNLNEQGKRWRGLLVDHGIERPDAEIAYAVRCSLLHGYGVPGPKAKWANNKKITLTPATQGAYALFTERPGEARLSVPVFCSWLTERIAREADERSWSQERVDISTTLASLSSLKYPQTAEGLSANPLYDRPAARRPAAGTANTSAVVTGGRIDPGD